MNLSLEHIDNMIKDLVGLRTHLTGPDQAYFLLLTYVSSVTGVSEELIRSEKRHKKYTEARCLLIYHMFEMGYTKKSISSHLEFNHVAIL